MYKVLILGVLALPAIAQVRQNSIRLIPAPDNSQGTLEFQEQRPGSNVLRFRAPAAIANDITWTLPATDGTNGQSLVTNGSGVLSWGSGTGGSLPVSDATAIVQGSSDATKLLRFEVDGFTTGTTRVLTPQNASYTLAGTDLAQTFTAAQTFGGGLTITTGAVNGYVLRTNGSGVASWAAVPACATCVVSGGNTLGAGLTIGTNDNYDFNLERNNTTLINIGANGIDMAPGGVANFYNKVRKLEITGISGETAFWDIQAAANMASSSNFQIRDNAGSRAIRIDRAILGAPLNNILMYGNVIPQQRSTAGGDAVNDAVLPSLGTTSSPWTDLFLSNSVSARAFTSSDGTHTRISLNNPGAGSNAGSAWIVRDASGNIAGSLSYAGTLSATSVSAANVTASGATHLQTTGIGEASPAKGLLSVYGSNGYAYTPFNIVAGARIRTGANSAILLGTTSANTSGWTRGMYWSFQTDDFALSRFKDDETSVPKHDLYISTDGLVGINTTSPSEELTVNGSIDVIGSGAIEIAGTTVIDASRNATVNNLTISGTCTGCSGLPAVDTSAILKGSGDATKLLRFEIDGFSTGTTRILTPQNASYTLAGTDLAQTFTAMQSIEAQLWVNAGNSLVMNRATRGTNQKAYWVVAGNSATTGAWSIGTTPSGAASRFVIDHNNTEHFVVGENGLIETTGGANFNGIVSTTTFNATGNPAYRVSGTTVIDASRNASIVGLTINGGITGDLIPSTSNLYTNGSSTSYWNMVRTESIRTHGGNVQPATSLSGSLGASTGRWSNTFTQSLNITGSVTGDLVPAFSGSYLIGGSSARWLKVWAQDADFSGTITAPNGNTGWSGTRTIRDSAGTGTCTLIFSGGILTGGTC